MKHGTTNPPTNDELFIGIGEALNHCAKVAALAELLERANPAETPDRIIQTGGMIFDETEKLREILRRLLRNPPVSK